MKPVLYVGLKGICGFLPLYPEERDLILVTSEKGSAHRRQVYGRDADGVTTHAKGNDIIAMFPDLDTARKALAKAQVAHDAYCVVIERAKMELRNLQATQQFAVKTAISDFTIP
jgi:hypothetical protein